MAARKKYVIDIDTMEVKDTSVGNGMEYEIIASKSEIEEIERHFSEMRDDSVDSLKHILYPFNEKAVDKDRESYHSHILSVFQLIKTLGTDKTKKDIDSLKLFK